MWELTIFWNDSVVTKEQYQDYKMATQAINLFIRLSIPLIDHFKLKYRGDQNE